MHISKTKVYIGSAGLKIEKGEQVEDQRAESLIKKYPKLKNVLIKTKK